MKTTIHTCDKCNKSVSEKELVTIGVELNNIYFESDQYNRRKATLDICKDCLRNKGFVITETTKENKDEIYTKNAKTLESKIIEILEDLDVAFHE